MPSEEPPQVPSWKDSALEVLVWVKYQLIATLVLYTLAIISVMAFGEIEDAVTMPFIFVGVVYASRKTEEWKRKQAQEEENDDEKV